MGILKDLKSKLSHNKKPMPRMTATTSVHDILESPQFFNQIVIQARSEFSPENPAFLMAVTHFRALSHGAHYYQIPAQAISEKGWIPPQYRGSEKTMGIYLYDTFIKKGCSLEVNISNASFLKLETIWKSPGTPFTMSDFDEAFTEVANLMKRDTQKRAVEAATA